MLTKENVITSLHYLATVEDIDQSKFALGMDAALVMMGLKEKAPRLCVWLEPKAFNQLAKDKYVTNHPMADTVINIELTRCAPMPPVEVEVRERNYYFGSGDIDGVDVFNVLTLMIQKRAEYSEQKARSAAPEVIQGIAEDLHKLNDIQAERNKVKEAV